MLACRSTIAEVCVYPGQAQIVRRGRVELPAGAEEVVFADLPLSLQPETVRVAGRGTARARLLGVEVGKARHALPPEESLRELDRRIEELEDQDRALADRVETLTRRLGVLADLGKASAERLPWGIARGTVDAAKLQSLLTALHQDEGKARWQVRKLEIERRGLNRELERLRRERDARAKPYTPDRYEVRVPVEVETPGELDLELTYVCQGATWAPLYDLRLEEPSEGGPKVTLGRLAEVSQRSGEDWEGVHLTLSTARPALAARLPELPPWYIDIYRPRPPMAMRAALGVGVTMAAPEDEMAMRKEAPAAPPPMPLAEAVVAEAEVRAEGPAIVFVAPGSPSVPADGSAHKVFLGTQELPATIDWVTAPKTGAHVYRRARVRNTTPAVLLPGRASVFYGETFIGTTPLRETPTQGELEIYLGVDDQVQVERELVERTVDKAGFVEKVRRLLFAYRIRVHNFRPTRVALTVLDQIPVSRNETLKVKLVRSEPQAPVGEMGELRWELSLAAGEERDIVFAFQVEMPLDSQAEGLP